MPEVDLKTKDGKRDPRALIAHLEQMYQLHELKPLPSSFTRIEKVPNVCFVARFDVKQSLLCRVTMWLWRCRTGSACRLLTILADVSSALHLALAINDLVCLEIEFACICECGGVAEVFVNTIGDKNFARHSAQLQQM